MADKKGTKIKTAAKPKHEVFQMLRTCGPDMSGSSQRLINGNTVDREPFIWEEGKVLEAEDYDPAPICGGGLHGLKDGNGNWGLLDWDPNAIGVIFENIDCPVIDIDGEKVKVQKAKIVEKGPLPTLLAKFLPNFIRELAIIIEIDVITVSKGKDSLTNDKEYAKIGSSGEYAKIGSSGNNAKIGSSGYNAKIGSSGNNAKIGSSGEYAKIGSSGNNAKIGSSGNNSVIADAGLFGKAKVGKNGAIALTYKDKNDRYRIAVGYEGEGLKADTWYSVNNVGEFIEVDG